VIGSSAWFADSLLFICEISCRQNKRLLVNGLGKMELGLKVLATILEGVFRL
jgi:hypothetical protein